MVLRKVFDDLWFRGEVTGGLNPKLDPIPYLVSFLYQMYHAFDSFRGLLDEEGNPRKMVSPFLA